MRLTSLLSFVSAGALLCLQAGLAQSPGGMAPGQSPSTFPGQTMPGQTPGMNRTLGPNSSDMALNKIDDKRFAKDEALNAMVEVELGKLAAQKASRDDIKQLGQKVVDDQAKANDQLKEVATKENIPIPDALDSKRQSRIDKISKLSGEDFDKAYVKEELKDRESQVRDFSAEAQGGTDANLKTFASNVLPTLQQELDQIKNLNKSEKNTAKENKGQ
jgi:putative membrane protein